jgi:tetratricopeptide (TPR) repeat protein
MYARTTIALLAMPFLTAPAFGAAFLTYDSCLTRAQDDPAGAFADATAWSRRAGGAAADHCAAVALVGLHRFGEAAGRLDALARSPFAADPARRAVLFDQAGNAWLLAGRPDSAIASFSAGLAADASDLDLLADRARALAAQRNWAKADSDLSVALLVDPGRADLYVLRGSARHALGRKSDARADFDRALRLQPSNADALLERGNVKFESGDAAGARADWQQAVSVAPGSAAADSARQRLAQTGP